MKLENEQLNMQVNSMREEISHYKTIIEKQKSSQSKWFNRRRSNPWSRKRHRSNKPKLFWLRLRLM